MELPTLNLSETPIRHEDSPLSLSTKFLDGLADIMAPTNCRHCDHYLVLSIGSRSGLVERLLADTIKARTPPGNEPRITVEGVQVETELASAPNKYLPETALSKIPSASDVTPRLQDPDVSALMFVYPHHPDIVSQHIRGIVEAGLNIGTVVWLGPTVDWVNYEPCFAGYYGWKRVLEVYPGEKVGLDKSETLAVWQK
ncbi:unnamed protein product [Clonostachys chloroleuca]|uniref:Uncharacterized protein n=1 Tax=Clonostachys chloroleuca TaxID=1926264 RepID=A0AA35VU73_9HYPO|nr:unnamed protein product [Clonostachys chloroleuca]